MIDNVFIFDCEVFAFDWLFVFKHKATGERTIIWNDSEAVREFMRQEPLLAGFNNKHYDQFILKAVLCDFTPEEVKRVNDFIIQGGHEGWELSELRDCGIYFDQYDLMDDCQQGLSLKAIEAHLGMDIRETTVSFDLDRPLTEEERKEVEFYCCHDVDATDKLDDLRQGYLSSKRTLGREKGIYEAKALYMTNAKLTAAYLDAQQKPHDDEREYQYPDKLLREYIPQEVFDFFDQLHDPSISNTELFGGRDAYGRKIEGKKLNFSLGECACVIGFGGIHGAIPCYREEATETRSIRNKDVASYYPHQMTLNGYCSRNIPSPEVYAAVIERRVKAKKSGDKATANALKLVLNTTYGAMLNKYNDLYDPLMGRSVCISGQLQLLELSIHLMQECPSLKIIQLNTDGIMVSLDNEDVPQYEAITQEWQDRTGFELEEDLIKLICQKDVNNYVEVPFEGEPKIKGGVLTRGIAPAGAFNINNNVCVVATAVKEYLAYGTPVEDTIMGCERLLDFQLIAKAGSKYGDVLHEIGGEMVPVQRVNRIYATGDYRQGTLYKTHLKTGQPMKIAGLPAHCVVDNENRLSLEAIDRDWYIRLAKRYVKDFLGKKGSAQRCSHSEDQQKEERAAGYAGGGRVKDWTGTGTSTFKTIGTSTFKTIGASNHTEKERETNDYYATEPKAAELLCDLFKFSPYIWECACGEGHLSEVFKRRGYLVKSTDLVDRGYGEGGVDFLQCTKPFAGDIITNPPYKYAQQFVEKALSLVSEGHYVAMLLKLTFMEGKGRKELFQKTPPMTIYVSSSRLLCAKNGEFQKMREGGGSAVAYGWYIWKKGYQGETIVKWFN